MTYSNLEAIVWVQIKGSLVDRVCNDEHVIDADSNEQERHEVVYAALLQSYVECNAKSGEVAKPNTDESHDRDTDSAMNWAARAKVDQGVAANEHDC